MRLSQQYVEMAEWWVADDAVESIRLHHLGMHKLASKVLFDTDHIKTLTTSTKRMEYYNSCRAFLCLLEAKIQEEEEEEAAW